MDFKQLETFVAIVKFKSFSKAAQHLFLTQPTISNHIQNLENELKTVLINRSSKKISLTKAGQIFYRYAIEILNKRENAVFALDEFKGKIEGELEISSSTIPEQYLLPSLLFKFNKKYPDVKYNLRKYDSGQVIKKILDGEIDFGFVGAKSHLKQLEYMEIMDDEIVLAAPNCKEYKDKEFIDLKELMNKPIIMREEGSGTRKILEEELLKHDISMEDLNIIAVIENTETIKECVKNEMGLTFISERAVNNDIKNKSLIRISIKDFQIQRKFYFVYHQSRALSPLAETFKHFVLKEKESLDIKPTC